MKAVQDIEILDLIPQRPPFVMVDRLLYYSESVSKTEFKIEATNLFCKGSYFSEYGIIENMAQSCAARIGYKNLTQKESIKIGFIGAIKEVVIFERPQVGELIHTVIEVISEVFSMTLVKAEVFSGERLLAQSEMKISISDIEL